jgi:hypothetical protein
MWDKQKPAESMDNKAPCGQSASQYIKKGNFYSGSIPEVDNWPFHKRLQIVYFNLSSAEDQAWYREQ